MEDIVKEYRKKEERKFANFFANIGIGQVIMIGILLFFIVSLSNNNNTDPRYNYIFYSILIGIILVLYFKPTKQKFLIPDHEAKRIAQESLNRKIRGGKEFTFDSKIFVNSACHLKYENDMTNETSGPVAWEIGFIELIRGTQYKREGVIRIHPYDGIVTGISFMPLGYSGRESRDRDIIPVGIVEGKIKTTDLGNK